MIKTQHCPNCEATEQELSDYKQKVSDACRVLAKFHAMPFDAYKILDVFIIPAPKPDPIAEAWIEATGNTVGMGPLNAALDARGLEIREKNDDQ